MAKAPSKPKTKATDAPADKHLAQSADVTPPVPAPAAEADPAPAPKRRGRKPNAAKAQTSPAVDMASAPPAAETAPKPKPRGRKAGAANAKAEAAAGSGATAQSPPPAATPTSKSGGRKAAPAKASTAPAADKAPPPRRKAAGRKPAAASGKQRAAPRKPAGSGARTTDKAKPTASAPVQFVADKREQMGNRNFFASVIGGVAAVGATVAGVFFALQKGQGGPKDAPARADSTNKASAVQDDANKDKGEQN